MSLESNKYNKLNKKSIKGNLIIYIIEQQIIQISKSLLDSQNCIIPLEYLNEKIRLECIKNNKPILLNDETRLSYLINILRKECKKGTSQIVSSMCK
jgi:hypothetical protein